MSERLHVKVINDSETTKKGEKTFWFAKSTVTGKVLDLLVDQFGVSCESDANPFQLVKISATKPEEYSILRNNENFANHVEDGSTLALVRSDV